MLLFFKKSVISIESAAHPLWYFVLSFFSAVTLRIFLEFFSDNSPAYPPAMHLFDFITDTGLVKAQIILHYYSFFAALGLCLVLLLYVFTRHEIVRLFRLVATGFAITVIVPVIDLLFSAGRGFDMGYLFPDTFTHVVQLFFTFFGPLRDFGVTPGMRVEILLVLLATFVYFFSIRKQALLRSVVGTMAVYSLIFLFLISPYILQTISHLFGVDIVQYSNASLRNLYVLVGYVAGLTILILANRANAIALLRDIRAHRLLHYWLMLGIGIFLASKTGFISLTDENIFFLPLLLGSIFFAWMFSVVTNNISDMDIDEISNPARPLVAGVIDPAMYKRAALVTLFLSLGLALAVGFNAFFLIMLFIGNYFIYSMPPLRLKRVPYFSKLAILVNSGALIALGFMTFTAAGSQYFPNLFRSEVGGFLLSAEILIAVSPFVLLLAMNFIDIKDYEGDKAGGIKTLPVLLGLPASKFLIGGAFLFLYTVIGALIGGPILFGAVGLGLLQFYIINRERYEEKYVFAVYLSSLLALFFIP